MNSLYGSTGMAPRQTATGNMNPFKEKIPKGYGVSSFQQFDPSQMNLYESLFGHLGPDSYLQKLAGGDPSLFAEMESPALKQFSGLQGNIASRFSGGGGGPGALGSRRSSGFQNVSNQAATDFASQLQANRQSLQRQARMDLFDLSNSLMSQRPFHRELYEKAPPKQGFNWQGLAGAGLGAVGGFFAGNPIGGAMAGYGIGSSLGGHGGGEVGGNYGQFNSPSWDNASDWAVNNLTGW